MIQKIVIKCFDFATFIFLQKKKKKKKSKKLKLTHIHMLTVQQSNFFYKATII